MNEREALIKLEEAWRQREEIGNKAGQALINHYRDRAVAAELKLASAIEVLKWLDRQGGLGYDKHDRIRGVVESPRGQT